MAKETDVKKKVLIVDDEDLIRISLCEIFSDAGFEVISSATCSDAIKKLENEGADLVLLDLVLPDMSGLDFLKEIKERALDAAVIVITAFGTIESAVKAVKLGACDYITKPFEAEEVVIRARKALRERRLEKEVQAFKKAQDAILGREKVVFRSKAMGQVMEKLKRLAQMGVDTLLLTGETGVGKDLLARFFHRTSIRKDGPFVAVNCTAIPKDLFESELFGYEKGAFTGAVGTKKGLAEMADGGTLFLDEVGDVDIELQGKFLRFVEYRSFRKLGGKSEKKVNLAMVFATNRNLEEKARNGLFREDLFFRVSSMVVEIPPLRERPEDIMELAMHFLSLFGRKYGKHIEGFDKGAEKLLMSYHWPGNVRELKAAVEQMVIFSEEKIITYSLAHSIVGNRIGSKPEESGIFKGPELSLEGGISFRDAVSNYSRLLIEKALEASGYNQRKAAELLGLDRSTLRYKMKMLGIRSGKN